MVKENHQNCDWRSPMQGGKTFLLKVQLSSIFKSTFYLDTQHLELSFLLASWSNKNFFYDSIEAHYFPVN